MKQKTMLYLVAFFVLALPLILIGNAGAANVDSDGAVLNANGGWDLPADLGSCSNDSSVTSRRGCYAVRFPNYADATACSSAPNFYFGNMCTANSFPDQAACEAAGAVWHDTTSLDAIGGGTSCTFSLEGLDFNSTSCADLGGTWAGACGSNFTSPGPIVNNNGNSYDGCLKCHNNITQYNSNAIRWKQDSVLTGHRNMLRKVNNTNLGGPGYASTNSDDRLGFANVTGVLGSKYTDVTGYSLDGTYYIYGGWYRNIKQAQINRVPLTNTSPAPAGHQVMPSPSKVTSLTSNTYNNSATSCASCHSTGYGIEGATQPTTVGTGYFQWHYEGLHCDRCHDQNYDNTHRPGNSSQYAEFSTKLCYQCHEQHDVAPNEVLTSNPKENNGAIAGHYRTNQFLNSPHARFEGGHDDVKDYTKYDSHFSEVRKTGCSDPVYLNAIDCTTTGAPATWNGAALVDTTRNRGCVGCHDVHISSVDPDVLDATNDFTHIKNNCGVQCHSTKMDGIKHPTGPGTPLDGNLSSTKGIAMACITCHMGPGTNHFFRINTDASYSTIPATSTEWLANNKLANTYDEDGYAAVGMDLDLACGQCHGGSGTAKAGIMYFNKAQLAVYAAGMHTASALPPTADHTGLVSPVIKGSPVSFVDASKDNNHQSISSIMVNWGDGSTTTGAAGATFSHTYAGVGMFNVIHTATDAGGRKASELISVQVVAGTTATKAKITINVTTTDVDPTQTTAITNQAVRIYLKKDGLLKGTAYTNASGTAVFSNLDAADGYALQAYKSGVDFGGGKGKLGTITTVNTSGGDQIVPLTGNY